MSIVLFAAALAAVAGTDQNRQVDNQFVTMTISPGWVAASRDQVLVVSHEKYVLRINPIFMHASGVEGGRFSEITDGMAGIGAVMREVDQPAGGFECSEASSSPRTTSAETKLNSLYTDSSKTGNGCTFPDDGKSAWFGATAPCANEGECTITLDYDTDNVNALPKKDSREIQDVLSAVETMLNTVRFNKFLLISKISPQSVAPGATVTVYGAGFNVPKFPVGVALKELTEALLQPPAAAEGGKSLTFKIPVSLQTISCPSGKVDVNGWCVPIPENHVDINDCPPKVDGSTNFCGVPVPPNTYHLSVALAYGSLYTDEVPLTITPSAAGSVSVSLLYPDSLISPGQPITVRGKGFRPTGNNVEVGSAVVENVPSADGKILVFKAPAPSGPTLLPHFPAFEVFVSNPNGKSNSIVISYR
ncbi:MAG: hypothetical protein ABR874_06370 [Candidatus Sulfotelmatobacter sp.]|jgi:hypothetical protein